MNVAESTHECNQHEQCCEVDCEVLTINKKCPDIERGINVGNDDLTLVLVIPEREAFECVRGDSMSTSL